MMYCPRTFGCIIIVVWHTSPMSKIVVLESEGYCQTALDAYRRLGTVAVGPWEGDRLDHELADAEVLVIRLGRINAAFLSKTPRLRFIASPTTGLDHVDLAACERRDINIVSLKGRRDITEKIYATSEHTIALMLALLRRLPSAYEHVVRDGGWDRERFVGSEISGKIVGIVGYGRLGTRVATIVRAMGATVIAADPFVESDRVSVGVELVALEVLLQTADMISVHATLTKETEGLMGEREFGMMKEGAYFVNTARGQIVDEMALCRALESDRLAGAALDVMCGEQGDGSHLISNSLRAYAQTHQNLILTPHIGGATRESMALTEIAIAEEVLKRMSVS